MVCCEGLWGKGWQILEKEVHYFGNDTEIAGRMMQEKEPHHEVPHSPRQGTGVLRSHARAWNMGLKRSCLGFRNITP